MKRLFALCIFAACQWLVPGQALAEDTPAPPTPDLVGTWAGPFQVMRSSGVAQGQLKLNVLSQDGPLLKAEKTWETPGVAGYVGDKEVEKATETLVGVIDFDGKSVHFAEQGDNGLYSGQLTAPDTLELIYIEAGHGTAYRVHLTRTK